MRQGSIYLNLSGNRKATSVRCNTCSEAEGRAVFHETHRGLAPESCPRETGDLLDQRAPAHIAREKLGTPPRVKNWNVIKFAGLVPTGGG